MLFGGGMRGSSPDHPRDVGSTPGSGVLWCMFKRRNSVCSMLPKILVLIKCTTVLNKSYRNQKKF